MVKIIMNLLNEYEWSNDQCIFPKTDRNSVLDDTFTIFTLNVRSLAKHVNNIVHRYSYLRNDIIRFKENPMKISESTSVINGRLKSIT